MAEKFQFIYSDPSTYTIGESAYGTYDSDIEYKLDVVTVTKWVARRLGHPVMQLEFNSGSIYTMFEESISEYSQHMNNYNIKNWMWNSYGSQNTGSNLGETENRNPHNPRMGATAVLSDQYGEAAAVGGDATLYSGSITLVGKQQEYDLQSIYSSSLAESGKENSRIIIQRVFNYPRAAMTRFWDPFIGTFDQRMMLDQFGFASYAPSTTFMLRPIYYDVLRAGAIETSDYIRRSNFSFQINNNKVDIFPIPDTNDSGNKIWFEYYVKDEVDDPSRSWTDGKVSDPSNVPYKFIKYNGINSSGRQWIRKFTLSLSKELLGIIRSKYAEMPLPGGSVVLDGDSLKAEGREEKQQLLEELNIFLDSVTVTEKMKAEAEEADAAQTVLNKAPLSIFIG